MENENRMKILPVDDIFDRLLPGTYSIYYRMVDGNIAKINGHSDFGVRAVVRAFQMDEIRTIFYEENGTPGVIVAKNVLNFWWERTGD